MRNYKFDIDKVNNAITIEKSFISNINDMWNAWTQSHILDQWWAPKPWHAETKEMSFTEGGKWLYAMVSPELEKIWSTMTYKNIIPLHSFTAKDAFTDENGVAQNNEHPSCEWQTTLEEKDNSIIVKNVLTFKSEEDMKKILEMGFKEGYEMGLNNLEFYLEKRS